MSDAEKQRLAADVLQFVDGRVPVVLSITHFSARIAAEKAARAEKDGAAAVLTLPPLFGRWRSGPDDIVKYLKQIADACSLPIILQDHPLTDIILKPGELCAIIEAIPTLDYLKMEIDTTPVKIRDVIRQASGRFRGIFTGMGGIRLFWELEAGAVGCMPSSIPARSLADIIHLHWEGRREESFELFRRWLPFLNFTVQLGRRDVVKQYLRDKGIISTAVLREPNLTAWNDWTREQYDDLITRCE